MLGLMGQVWCLDSYMLAMHRQDADMQRARQEEQMHRLLLADIGKVVSDGREYYVRYGQVECMAKSSPVEKWRLTAQVRLMNPREANVGDVVHGPSFEQTFHPGEHTLWYYLPPLRDRAIVEPIEAMVTRSPRWTFMRLPGGHWQRVS